MFDKQSEREVYERVDLGSLFLFARQVRFSERRGAQCQTHKAGGWVKTNYGGVKKPAQ